MNWRTWTATALLLALHGLLAADPIWCVTSGKAAMAAGGIGAFGLSIWGLVRWR